jgi:gas vesicle protein
MSMPRNDSTGVFFGFLVGIGVGATAVILLGSKRIDQLHDDLIEVMNDGVKGLRRRAQKTVNTAWQKLDQAIDIGADAYNEAKRS